MFENLLQTLYRHRTSGVAAALTGLKRCFLQIPRCETQLLLIVKACDSWRHPPQMDTGFHSIQKWNCTWVPRPGSNLLHKFVETEEKSHYAIEQMQCIRHLPKAGDISPGTTGYCKTLTSPWNPDHWQETLTNTSFSSQGWHFSTSKRARGKDKPTKQPPAAPGLHRESTNRLHLICIICGDIFWCENNAIRKQLL